MSSSKNWRSVLWTAPGPTVRALESPYRPYGPLRATGLRAHGRSPEREGHTKSYKIRSREYANENDDHDHDDDDCDGDGDDDDGGDDDDDSDGDSEDVNNVAEDDVEDDEVQSDDVEDDEVQGDDVKDDEAQADDVKDDDEDDNVEDEADDDRVEEEDVEKEDDDDDGGDDDDGDVEDDKVDEGNEKDDNADVAEDEVEVDDVKDGEVKGVEDDDVKNDAVEEEEEDHDVEDDDVEVDDQSEDRDPHFVRACTIEMHMNVSQVTRALLCGTLQTKREPNSHGRLSANLRIRNAHMDMWQEPFYPEIYKSRAADQEQAKLALHIFREPAHSQCTWTCHKSKFRAILYETGHFIWDFTGKGARTQTEHLDQSPASTLTVRTPECGHAAQGKKEKPSQLQWLSTTNSRPQLGVTSDHATPLENLFWTEAWESAPQLWCERLAAPRGMKPKKGRSLTRTWFHSWKCRHLGHSRLYCNLDWTKCLRPWRSKILRQKRSKRCWETLPFKTLRLCMRAMLLKPRDLSLPHHVHHHHHEPCELEGAAKTFSGLQSNANTSLGWPDACQRFVLHRNKKTYLWKWAPAFESVSTTKISAAGNRIYYIPPDLIDCLFGFLDIAILETRLSNFKVPSRDQYCHTRRWRKFQRKLDLLNRTGCRRPRRWQGDRSLERRCLTTSSWQTRGQPSYLFICPVHLPDQSTYSYQW